MDKQPGHKICLSHWSVHPLITSINKKCVFFFSYLGAKFSERYGGLEEETGDRIHRFKTPDVLQNNYQIPICHHKGWREHGILSPVSHHPQSAWPHEEDKCQPAHICNAPGLRNRDTHTHNSALYCRWRDRSHVSMFQKHVASTNHKFINVLRKII